MGIHKNTIRVYAARTDFWTLARSGEDPRDVPAKQIKRVRVRVKMGNQLDGNLGDCGDK